MHTQWFGVTLRWKTFCVKTTGTTEPKLAAAIIVRINTQVDKDWERPLKGLPLSVSDEVNASVEKVLDTFGLNRFGHGLTEGKQDFNESVFDQLPDTVKSDVIFNGLPVQPFFSAANLTIVQGKTQSIRHSHCHACVCLRRCL